MKNHMGNQRLYQRLIVATLAMVGVLSGLLPVGPFDQSIRAQQNGGCGAQGLSCSVTVPGTANPWLAGAAPNTDAGAGDSAPAQSPVFVACLPIKPCDVLRFSATGSVSNCPGCIPNGPDGGALTSHLFGAQFGISDITARVDSLVGVFLGPSSPTDPPPPAQCTAPPGGARSPQLQEVFSIGDGVVGGTVQACLSVRVPCGATRLFLGVMDGFEWNNNTGSFSVTVSKEPSFDICIQDDGNGNTLQLDLSSGLYLFIEAGSNLRLNGRGTITIAGCTITLKNSVLLGSPHTITATTDICQQAASATITIPSGRVTRVINIRDLNTSDNTCAP